jgi:muramidase (phage lysozyme)
MTMTIPVYGLALLDAIAVGESEPAGTPRGSGYNKLCGGGTFSDFSHFPEWSGWREPKTGKISHAAGRLQDEPRTWASIAAACGLTDFTPESQDIGNWWLASTVYQQHTGRDLGGDLAAGKLDLVVPALRTTWPSLSTATFPARYTAALKERTPPEPAPAPQPPAAPGWFGRLIAALGRFFGSL